MTELNITLQFSGGMELLFDKQIEIKTSIPSEINGVKTTMKELIEFVKDKHLKERPELFVDGDTVRPGILVLINDADWELEGELEYEVAEGDKIVFISTLHGG
ncbi:ubiquitin related modifier 1 [Conidiobolus coronatus NRRL 28638]|uniref:Ubiquitin-related modifier 1 n=1 Tax=Conidiobolus coronatus (strain ATCC 28846 / CBS 209.66 / NRRL 28638) TaxID=796925 RepID=A0A137P6N7_CONC2|nr:ubiquitin related modifier 1 [Conidiobolus coronatus NRRL 28638]|eukprot:KXN70629.1 ubiquitin related modifier 1 [Conidiobolus coronatus NRRL 28638]